MTETNTKEEQSLVKTENYEDTRATTDEYINEFKGQAQEYGQKLQDAAIKAKDYANEKYVVANEKFKELKKKDPQELVEDAKEYARQKPTQALLISAAAGLVLGLILKNGRR